MLETPEETILAPDIDPQLLQRLGMVVSRWAYVEALEGEFLAFLAHADPGAMYVLTQSVTGATLTDWLRILAPIRLTHPDTTERLKALFTRIDETRSERNVLVHGLCRPGPEPGTLLTQTVKWERAEVVREELMTAPDLDDLIQRIHEIAAELIFLGKRLGFHKAPPKRQKYPKS